MPIKHIKRHIHRLRQEPEHVRLQAVTVLTAISGFFMVILWITVLLPLQLHFVAISSDDKKEPIAAKASVSPDNVSVFSEVPQPTATSRVSGAQDRYVPSNIPVFLPVNSPEATSSETPAALPLADPSSEPAVPVQIQP